MIGDGRSNGGCIRFIFRYLTTVPFGKLIAARALERINLHAPLSKMELKENRILYFGKLNPH
jgi:hypothetical protein